MIFSLNTIIGFACAIGMNMGFSSKHHNDHEEAKEALVHIHADGKQHIHKERTNSHSHTNSHHYDKADKHKTDNHEKDNCCNDKVIKFEQLDKSLTPSVNAVFNPVFFTALLASFHKIGILFSSKVVPNTRYFKKTNPAQTKTTNPTAKKIGYGNNCNTPVNNYLPTLWFSERRNNAH